MSDVGLIITMVSVFIGFLVLGGSFKSFMDGRPQRLVWSLFTVAVVCITVVPVIIGVFWATR